jgi:glycosyltransferase
MHSDDEFYDQKKSLTEAVVLFFFDPTIDGVYGDGVYVSNDIEERRIWNRIEVLQPKSQIGLVALHPTVSI